MLRGGAWINGPSLMRSADRLGFDPELRINFVGLRVTRASD